jgi:hypothetical protein
MPSNVWSERYEVRRVYRWRGKVFVLKYFKYCTHVQVIHPSEIYFSHIDDTWG